MHIITSKLKCHKNDMETSAVNKKRIVGTGAIKVMILYLSEDRNFDFLGIGVSVASCFIIQIK